MKKRFLLLIVFMATGLLFSQGKKQSEVIKQKGFHYKTPLLKPKYPSYNLAATYMLQEKAKKGDPFAQHELGLRFIMGIGIPKDSVKAAYWIKKAAEKKLPAANFNYAIMLNNGMGVDWNPFEAFKNFKIAAESGMEQAQYILGLSYIDNLIVSKNLKTAYYWLHKAADKGFKEAKNVIKKISKSNNIVLQDSTNKQSPQSPIDSSRTATSHSISNYEPVLYDFNKDTLSNNQESIYLQSVLTSGKEKLKRKLKIEEDNFHNVSEDTSAIGMIYAAAEAGSPEALLLKGRLLKNGVGVKRNSIKSAASFLKAFRLGSYKAAEYLLTLSRKKDFFPRLEKEVKKNNPEAMYVWAGLVALGMDYSLTEKQAFNLLEKARKQNHINSIIELGLAYYNGTLTNKDSVKAIEYLNEAAALGSSEAEIRLAFFKIKENPDSVFSNEIILLKKFANQGSVLATAILAFCYEYGYSVKMNKAKADRLYRMAAQRGNEAAYNSLREMYNKIRPDDEEFKIYF